MSDEKGARKARPRARGRALVTGASRGIGRAVCEALVRKGWDVIGTCRDPKKIEPENAVPGVTYLTLDLTSQRSIDAMVRRVKQVDLLVNNAGTSMIGPVEEVNIDSVRALFELNFFGPLRVTQGFLAAMREKRKGTIIFIGSMSGETAVPFSSMYAASKAALRAMARTLRTEVGEIGIKVSVIAPFYVHTTIPQEKQYGDKSPYIQRVRRVKEVRDSEIASGPSPRVIAGKVLQILEEPRPRAFYPAGRNADLQAFLIRHLPRGIVDAISSRRFEGRKEDR